MELTKEEKLVHKSWLWIETFLLGMRMSEEEIEKIKTNFLMNMETEIVTKNETEEGKVKVVNSPLITRVITLTEHAQTEEEAKKGHKIEVVTSSVQPKTTAEALFGDLINDDRVEDNKNTEPILAVHSPKAVEDIFDKNIKGMGHCEIDDLPF